MGTGLFLAERYLPEPDSGELAAMVAERSQIGPGIELIWVLFSRDDATALVLLRADSQDRALDGLRRCGFQVDRITAVQALAAPIDPGHR